MLGWLVLARHLRVVLFKELKELIRDPRILLGVVIVPLVMFPLMGYALGIAGEAAQKEIMRLKIGLIDEDNSSSSMLLRYVLEKFPNVVLIRLNSSNWIEEAWASGVRAVLRVPRGFELNLSSGVPGLLEVYVVVKSISIGEASIQEVIESILRAYAKVLSISIIKRLAPSVNASTVLKPVIVTSKAIVKGNVTELTPKSFISAAMNQTIMMPIIIMVLIMIASQVAATSVAMEKEEKTLETLLTLPVKRITILWGKLIGSAIVAIAGVLAYMIGFVYYMDLTAVRWQALEGIEVQTVQVPLEGYAILAASLFFSLMSALALAILLGAYTQDVRSAHSLLGILYIPVFVPAFILMFADISTLPLSLQAILYAIPFSHPMIAAKSIVLGDYFIPLLGVFYNMAFMVAVLFIAAKFFKSEKVVIARLTFRKKVVEER